MPIIFYPYNYPIWHCEQVPPSGRWTRPYTSPDDGTIVPLWVSSSLKLFQAALWVRSHQVWPLAFYCAKLACSIKLGGINGLRGCEAFVVRSDTLRVSVVALPVAQAGLDFPALLLCRPITVHLQPDKGYGAKQMMAVFLFTGYLLPYCQTQLDWVWLSFCAAPILLHFSSFRR